ncbi:MerR family transcriptional regulator [Psychrobium sp. 1_MG-2023]|uniref:MerR family transcriptional regulator n=1 Tax=Psychrobium sp. 1_MG-2023 TaxID=3062624 RepID=UPI000C335452|nr:MerR family transcriptional regulator [Psychrobium sp. 1_MG-2023]MDP2559684.1 MerR family transcriptional regulator [Psychrobium sp. 1_MG-2023]PKF59515.1 heavy metal-responsive transcriptional regulator [Alteromonadales bacterium alter-6D02]
MASKTIGQVVELTGLSAKAIRYYESSGIVSEIPRANNGYRFYSNENVDELLLLKGAREAGFSIDQCRQLMAVFHDQNRHSSDVKAMTLAQITQIKQRIEKLQSIVLKLEALTEQCQGNDQPQCSIIDGLLKS